MDLYDVIIVGTGAGGGTLARSLAPSGKRILLLERGDWLPREPAELARAGRVRRQPLRVSPDTWYDEKGKPVPAAGPLLRRRRDQAVRRRALPAAATRTSASSSTTTGSRRRGRSATTSSSPTTRGPSSAYEVHGARGEDPTEGPASAPYPFPAVSHEPRIQQLADDLEAAGYHPFHAPCGIRLNEANMPYSVCVRCQNCDGFPCAVHGKSDAEVLGVRPALEHPNVTLLTNAQVVEARDERRRHRGDRVVVEHDGETETYAADIVVLACGAANTAKLLLCSANDKHPNGLANGSDQVGRNYMFHASQAVLALSTRREPDDLPEDARAERLLLRQRRARLSAREHPDGRQVAGADVPRREAGRDEARAELDAREGREARDRLLALDRGPAAARQPRDRRRRRQADARLHGRRTTSPKQELYEKLQVDARQAATWSPTTCSTASRT